VLWGRATFGRLGHQLFGRAEFLASVFGANDLPTLARSDPVGPHSHRDPARIPPSGMTLSDQGEGRAVLEQLPLFPDTAAELLTAPGFVDGRWSRFAESLEDFEASRDSS